MDTDVSSSTLAWMSQLTNIGGGVFGKSRSVAYLVDIFILQVAKTNVTAAGGILRGEIVLLGSTIHTFP